MALASLTELTRFKRGGKTVGWPVGYPVEGFVKFRAPADQANAAFNILVWSAEHSLVISVHNLNFDPELADIVLDKLKDPKIHVQLTLENAGSRDSELLDRVKLRGNSVAWAYPVVGAECVIDGLDTGTFNGVTLTVTREPMVAFEARTWLDMIHVAGQAENGKG